MKARRGNAALSGLKAKLRAMPTSLAHDIAQNVAPVLSNTAGSAYDTRRTVYGESRPTGRRWHWEPGATPEPKRTADGRFAGREKGKTPGHWEVATGIPLDLEDSGKTRSSVSFTADGRLVRAALGTRWAKFLIGKFRILPNGPMPVEWKRQIEQVVHRTKADLK